MEDHRETPKSINLALQGGGAHGAYTWGVMDRLFEDERIHVETISGTSAGAVNAVVAAHGIYDGGREGARAKLRELWTAIGRAGTVAPIRRSPLAWFLGDWSLVNSPSYRLFDVMTRVASPYETNPLGINPLREILGEIVDFDKVRGCTRMNFAIAATNVRSGRLRMFVREDIDLDAVMASACLPTLFHAVHIEGEAYWDGGYMGNPPLFPFYDNSDCSDIVIVQINPMHTDDLPVSAQDIVNRMSEINLNSSLLHELRMMELVNGFQGDDILESQRYRAMRFHMVELCEPVHRLDASSKYNVERRFLEELFDIGRAVAADWLDASFDDLGQRSTLDVGRFCDP